MDEPKHRIAALVLTHNAPTALEECLTAIERQTRAVDEVIVVDSASSPPAQHGIRSFPVALVRLDDNVGPGGGHAVGIERFLESDADLAWVMDDDCVPAPHCLERLLAHLDADSQQRPVLPWWIDVATGEGSFLPAWCGFLIARSVVERVGLPRADFVWWAEDTEYLQWRVQRAGFPLEREPDAVVEHRRIRATASRPPWKVYYEVRNTIFFRLYLQRAPYKRFRRMFRSLGKMLGQIVLHEHRKGPLLTAYARGMFDGLTGRLGVRMPLASPSANV